MQPITALTVAALVSIVATAPAAALGTAFTYQGQLKLNGTTVDGLVDVRFTLFDAFGGGNQVGLVQLVAGVDVVEGYFSVDLDFGGAAFTGPDRWLKIEVRSPAGAGAFNELTPRQAIRPAPYALFALSGNPGPAGPQGPSGPAGPTGSAGPQGTAGATGPQGAPGATGPAGSNGATGPQGSQGVQGPQGAQGPVGPAGDSMWSLVGGNAVFGTGSVIGGSVGIGTNTPDTTVEVSKSQATFRMTSTAVGTGTSLFDLKGATPIGPLGVNTLGSLRFLNGSNSVISEITGLQGFLSPPLAFKVNGVAEMVLSDGGKLGIGTYLPLTRLHVADGTDTEPGSGGFITLGESNSTNLSFDNNEIMARNNGAVSTLSLNADGGNVYLVQSGTGNVGIGTTVPKGKLHVDGDYYGLGHVWLHAFEGDNTSGTAYIQARDTSSTTTVNMQFRTKSGNSVVNVMRLNSNGRVGIGTTAPAETLHVNGTTRTNVLKITGGSDFAESFDVAGTSGIEPAPGMVVCIDPANPSKLVLSSRAYDRTVAGVISGANGIRSGMVMGQEGSEANGAFPVALSGRVYVSATATDVGIEPGDLLTSSHVPGHAMRVAEHDRSHGSIIGKAMTRLAPGETGMVLVLVNLQ